nr:T9SS type A sorting domain-containing protein [Bacteroidota bacterium]
MKYYITLFYIVIIATNAHSQGRNANWVFGDSAGIHFNGLNVPTIFKTNCVSKGETATMSDTSGNLLFYVYGVAVLPQPEANIYDNDYSVMVNGDSIYADKWYNTDIIIPLPSNDSIYYLFSTLPTSGGVTNCIILKKSVSDSGIVLSKNNVLLNNIMSDCIQAVKHGNGRDWWIITRLGGVIPNDTFFVWLVDPNGIGNVYAQNAGISALDGFHHVSFNSDGTQFIEVSASGIIEEFNFDRCNGTITSNRILHYPVTMNFPYYWGIAYSSSNRYVYMTQDIVVKDSSYIYQLDLSLLDPWLNRKIIWSTSPYKGIFLRLGPDKKIYVSHAFKDYPYQFYWYPYPDTLFNNENTHLGVINEPDSPAVSCDFQPYSFYLGPNARTYTGTSNLPDYNLGPLVGSGCDTLSLPNPSQGGALGTVSAYYHHDWQTIFVNAQNIKGNIVTMSVYDGLGSLKLRVENLKAVGGYFTQNINAANWPAGLYLIELKTEKEKIACKVVKY